jgi:hypothetical protein
MLLLCLRTGAHHIILFYNVNGKVARRQDGKMAIGLSIAFGLRNIFSINNQQSSIINHPCPLAV